MKKFHLLAATAFALTLSPQPASAAPAAAAADAQPRRFGAWGIDLTARDPAVAPGDSFFDFANGGWFKRTEIAADQPIAGVGLDLYNLTQDQLRAVIDDSARNPTTDSARKVGALYASFMDEARLESLDAAPLAPDLAAVKAVRTRQEMARLMGRTIGDFGSSFFNFAVGPDAKGKNVYTTGISIGGLGLPNRDYYLTDQFRPQRDAYRAYVARSLEMIGWPDAAKAAEAVLALETKIAEARWTLAQQRDPNAMYKPMSLAQLKVHAPAFPWDSWLEGVRAPAFDELVVTEDSAVPKVASIFAAAPIDDMKAWEAFHITEQAAPYLSKRFVDNRFVFIKLLSGQQQLRPRWQRGVSLVDSMLGEVLGQEYVHRHFPASSKAMMEEMVSGLQQAMRARIENAAWMSAPTKKEALEKLARQRVKVGYPRKWRDYSALGLDADDLYGNIKRAGLFAVRYQYDRIGKPVDRDEWLMTPQTVNAYFNPTGNEIVFPAAMLQAPMFDPRADAAVNYGAVGAVIGHEISHGFDDQGRQFDEKGVLRDWWAPQDAARFNAEAARLAAQYDGYEALPGVKVNGRQTLGENIGDQGGVKLALDAYHASLKGRRAPLLDGFTGDQRFFLGWAQGWRNKLRPEILQMIAVSDVHSPVRFRVDGTLRNIDQWYDAFNIRPGSKLYLKPEDRVRVW